MAPDRSASAASSAVAARPAATSPVGEHDLDEWREQPRPGHAGGLVERTADRGGGRDAVAGGQPEERETGIRLPSPVARVAILLLRLGGLASQAMELGPAVVRLADGRFDGWSRQPGLRTLGLAIGVAPQAVELHDLGPVDEAPTAERDEVGLGVAPGAERSGPFLRTAEVEDLAERLDRGAIDRPDGDRRHLAGRHRQHRLVEESHPASHLAHRDERLAATHPAVAGEIVGRRSAVPAPWPARTARRPRPRRRSGVTGAPRG